MNKKMQVLVRAMFLFIFIASQTPALTAFAGSADTAPLNSSLPATAGMSGSYALSNPGPAPAEKHTVASAEDFKAKQPARSQPFKGLFGLKFAAPLPAYVTNGGLEIEPITAYNLIVDSNVLAPSSYGPNSATFGARFCNRSGSAMTNVWAYIGDYDAVPASRTPGVYPIITPATAAANTGNAALGAALYTDYGGTVFSLKHESGTTTVANDASRYIGTLNSNQCVTQYWLVTYPRKAWNGTSWIDVTGGVKPEDDLWLQYDFWATSGSDSSNVSYYNRYVTMRNEISAMANKIWPNGDNKVPDVYKNAIQQLLGWSTWIPGSSGTTAYPGDTVISQGIWYDMGNVGAGFDNNYDLVPDRNAWLQPIGDASSYDPGCFRLVKSYGLVVVKLNNGSELLIPFVDQLYFENVPENNTGAVGLVFYEYAALDGACTAGLTPYQEVASGFDNEKFNSDFGAGIPPLQSRDSNMLLDKTSNPPLTNVAPGGTINYTLTFYLPDIAPGGDTTSTVTIGDPTTSTPLTYYDVVPVGVTYVACSAYYNEALTPDYPATCPAGTLAYADMTNYGTDPVPATVMFSTNGGASWTLTDPGSYTSASTSDQLHIKWLLSQGITSPATGTPVFGTVGFSATVPGGYTGSNVIENSACMKIGDSGPPTDGIVCDTTTILISGNSTIQGTVWKDDGVTTGILGNGIQDEPASSGIGDGADGDPTGVSVYLYWDSNGDGDYADAGDILYSTTTTDSNGNYSFTSLPATSGSARYIVVVDPLDSDIPQYYGPTTPTSYTGISLPASTTYGDTADEPTDFGFAPPLSISKTVATTTPIVVGDTIKYEIALTNNLPGSGTNNYACTYTAWTGISYPDNTSVPPGAGPTNARWLAPDSARFAPDGVFAYTDLSNNTNYLGLGQLNIGNMGGNITSVQYVAYVSEKSDLAAADYFGILPYYGNVTINTERTEYNGDGTWNINGVSQTAGTIFTQPVGTEYVITRTLNPTNVVGRSNWLWSDFTSTTGALEFQVIGRKSGSTTGNLNLDAFGIIITTDGTNCGNGSNGTLNPVPLTDTFNSAYFSFISADPAVTSSSPAGTLTWANVGPLYAGQTKVITVYLRALQAGTTTATDNTAASTNPKFANGIPANPVSDVATVTIGANANTRSLSGRVFDDNATTGWLGTWTYPGTGTTGYDGDDFGLQNIPVDLYACVGTNGVPITNANTNKTCSQSSGTWQYLQTTVTDANGDYSFTNLRQGYYYVQVQSALLSGSAQTADVNQSGVCTTCDSRSNDPSGNGGTEDLEDATFVGNLDNATTSIVNVNFGYNVDTTLFDIGDFVYLDQDGDGTIDSGEPGIPGVTVNLLGAGGGVIATTTTSYQVIDGRLDINGDGVITSADDGSTAGCTITDGVFSVCTTYAGFSIINGYVDVDGDTTTNGDSGDDLNAGYYLFTNRTEGTYTVQVDPGTLTGLIQTDDPDGSIDNTSTFILSADLLDRDFGYMPTGSGQIGDTVYRDMNGDGSQGGGESGISGVTVVLQVKINGAWVTIASDVTDSNGNYLFTGLPAGDYRVVIDRTANASAIPNDGFGNEYMPSNGTLLGSTVYMEKNLATNTSSDLTADFGFTPPASIGDTVYLDLDGDGTQDYNEPGIQGVTVTLYTFTDSNNNNKYDASESGSLVSTGQTDITDSDGVYNFTGLNPGYYAVVVTPPAGSTLTGDPSADGTSCLLLNGGTIPTYASVCDHTDGQRLYNGTNYTGADFGYQLPGNFGDTVWIDADNDGIYDVGETGIPEITVTATTTPPNGAVVNGVTYDGATLLTLTTETDANGQYAFTGITTSTALTWTVTVSASTGADPQWPSDSLSNSYDPDGGGNSSTTVVMDSSGAITNVGGCATTPNGCEGESDALNLDADFGYRFAGTASISGTICLETTNDGVCGDNNTDSSGVGTGETAFESVTVYLYMLNDTNTNGLLDPGETTTLVGTAITNANGDYSFTGLASGAGTYYVIAVGAPMDGLNMTSDTTSVNGGGDGSETTETQETVALDGDTVSALQVINATTAGDTIVDRDFSFILNGTYDFGDNPETYSVNLSNTPDGPRHLQSSNTLYFGTALDTEANGQPSIDASGDGSDEDGVLMPLIALENTDENGAAPGHGWEDGEGVLQFDIVGSGWLVGWIDWNNDGDFNDAGEMVISQAVSAGTNQDLAITTPTGAGSVPDGNYYARFRLFTSQPGIPQFAYSGAVTNGEVEDYRIPIVSGPTPVTLTYFKASGSGTVSFEWSTANETGNLGFNLYDGQMNRLNGQLIASTVLDSNDRQDYTFSAATSSSIFYIEDVALGGETRLHGPFTLGESYGDHNSSDAIDWNSVRSESGKTLRANTAAIVVNASSAGVYLKVNQTGLHRVTYEALRDAGFDLANTLKSEIKLTNRGTVVPINVYTRGMRFGAGSYIEFYGKALDTLYTDTNVYVLQVSKGGRSVPASATAANRAIAPLASFSDTVLVNNQNVYAEYAFGNDPWYDTYMYATNGSASNYDFTFNVTNLAAPTAPATLKLTLWGLTQWPANDDHHVLVSINGVAVGDVSSDGFADAAFELNIPAGTLHEGANTLRLTLPGDRGVDYDVIALDSFSVSYQRTFAAVNGRLAFTAAGKTLKVTNLPNKNLVVYRVDAKGVTRITNFYFQGSAGNYSATFAGSLTSAQYYVSTVDALYVPAFEAARKPSGLNTPAQYLIISHPDFISGLQPLIQARQAQGFSVNVVDVNDVYAQYSGGIFDPQAIKDYVAYAEQNLGTQYVLLVGGDSRDYRNYVSTSVSFIPSLYVKTGTYDTFVPSDALVADVDNDKAPEVAIGRFPVRNTTELAALIQKTLSYASKDYGQTAVFVADKYDGLTSFKANTIAMQASLPAGWSSQSIFLDDVSAVSANTQLINAMNSGKALVVFAGHSGPGQWGFPTLFNTAQAINLTNAGRPFVALQWGCWDNYYADERYNQLAQGLLLFGDRGAAATIGAVTRADSLHEEALSQLLTPRIALSGMTIGQAVQLSKAQLAAVDPSLVDVLYGFTILGDPALMIQP